MVTLRYLFINFTQYCATDKVLHNLSTATTLENGQAFHLASACDPSSTPFSMHFANRYPQVGINSDVPAQTSENLAPSKVPHRGKQPSFEVTSSSSISSELLKVKRPLCNRLRQANDIFSLTCAKLHISKR